LWKNGSDAAGTGAIGSGDKLGDRTLHNIESKATGVDGNVVQLDLDFLDVNAEANSIIFRIDEGIQGEDIGDGGTKSPGSGACGRDESFREQVSVLFGVGGVDIEGDFFARVGTSAESENLISRNSSVNVGSTLVANNFEEDGVSQGSVVLEVSNQEFIIWGTGIASGCLDLITRDTFEAQYRAGNIGGDVASGSVRIEGREGGDGRTGGRNLGWENRVEVETNSTFEETETIALVRSVKSFTNEGGEECVSGAFGQLDVNTESRELNGLTGFQDNTGNLICVIDGFVHCICENSHLQETNGLDNFGRRIQLDFDGSGLDIGLLVGNNTSIGFDPLGNLTSPEFIEEEQWLGAGQVQVDSLKEGSTFKVKDLDRHVCRKFVECLVGIQSVLSIDRNGTSEIEIIASGRDSSDKTGGSLEQWWDFARVRVIALELLTWLKVIGLGTAATIVSEGNNLRTAITVIVKGTVVLRASRKVNIDDTRRRGSWRRSRARERSW